MWFPLGFPQADPGGPGDMGPLPAPRFFFFKIMQLPGNFKKKLFWAILGLRAPLWSKLRWAPLTKILDPPLLPDVFFKSIAGLQRLCLVPGVDKNENEAPHFFSQTDIGNTSNRQHWKNPQRLKSLSRPSWLNWSQSIAWATFQCNESVPSMNRHHIPWIADAAFLLHTNSCSCLQFRSLIINWLLVPFHEPDTGMCLNQLELAMFLLWNFSVQLFLKSQNN